MKIQKWQTISKIISMILAVLSACILCSCGSSSDNAIIQRRRGTGGVTERAAETPIQEVQEEHAAKESNEERQLFLLTEADTEQKTVSLQKVSSGRQSIYAYDTGTEFLDKYGNTKSISSFLPGDAVEIELSDSKQKLISVQLSDQVWVYEDIVNYEIDEEKGAFSIGNAKYAYDSDRKVFSGSSAVRLSEVSSPDILRAVGIDKTLLSLSIQEGHGYLALSNTELFENSFICIGDKIFEEVKKGMRIKVPEGRYVVTVANNGYGGSREVLIERNRTSSLNLDELKGEGPKMCKITFQVGVEGAILRIDGKETDYAAPVELPYGVHSIAAEAAGYDTVEKNLVVNSKEAEIEIALSASGSSQAGDSSSKDSNNNTNSNNNINSSNNTNNNNSASASSPSVSNNYNPNNDYNSSYSNGNYFNNNTSQTDYLTTLYNLLTSINKSNSAKYGSSYGDLIDQ